MQHKILKGQWIKDFANAAVKKKIIPRKLLFLSMLTFMRDQIGFFTIDIQL